MQNRRDVSPIRRENDDLNTGTGQSQGYQRPRHEDFLYNSPENQQNRDIASSSSSIVSSMRNRITDFTKYWANTPPETERGRKLSDIEQLHLYKRQRTENQPSSHELQGTFEQQSLDPQALSQRSHELATRYTAATQLSREQLQQFQKDYSTHLQNLSSALKKYTHILDENYNQSFQDTINSLDQQIKTFKDRISTSISVNMDSTSRQDIMDNIQILEASKQEFLEKFALRPQIEQLQKDQQQAITLLQEINSSKNLANH